MAKQRPTYTLSEIETRLGYNIDSLNYPDDFATRFYSDLRPVPERIDERAERELEEHAKQRIRKYEPILDESLPDIGVLQVGQPSSA